MPRGSRCRLNPNPEVSIIPRATRGVASIALYYGANEDEAIAALLHDALEDSDASESDIRIRFGSAVADIVKACTDTEERKKPPWRPRKEKHIRALGTASDSARFVYAADKLQNARATLKDYRVEGDGVWKRFRGRKSGTLWYYRALIDVFRATGTKPALVDELCRTVNHLESLAYAAPA